jgi:hypothetical protein
VAWRRHGRRLRFDLETRRDLYRHLLAQVRAGAAEVFDDLAGGPGFVERIEMQAVNVGGEEFAALAGGPVDAVLRDGVGIVGDGVEFGEHLFGDDRAAHGGEFLDLGDVGHGHDAGDDGHGDADFAAAFDEPEEIVVDEANLRDDDIGAGIHLLLQSPQIGFEVGRFGMLLGIAGATEAEGVAEPLAEVTDQIHRVLEVREPACGRFGLAGRPVATEGKNVFDTVLREILQHTVDILERLPDAGEMGHRFEAELLFDPERDLQCASPGTAAGAVGARGEGRAQLVEVRERLQ